MSTPKEIVEKLLKENTVVIFSKYWCSFCIRVKLLFWRLGIEYKLVELNCFSNGPAIQDYLEERTGQRTVPNVFIHEKHIGGCDTIMELHATGKLSQLLENKK